MPNTQSDWFTLRVAVTLVDQEQRREADGAVRRTPRTGLGALRDLVQAAARPDELTPPAIAIGLDCSDAAAAAAFTRDMESDARDAMLVYDDHALLVHNPVRGAGLGTLVKLAAVGFRKQSRAKSADLRRIKQRDLTVAELVPGRPAWSKTEPFIHLAETGRELWFWVDLAVDSNDSLSAALTTLVGRSTTTST